MSRRLKGFLSIVALVMAIIILLVAIGVVDIFSMKTNESEGASLNSDIITLRVCNWEEYIDMGDWDEAIELDSATIMGENPMIKDFENWYYEQYGQKVRVEYSCFGTNEELYNMLTLGDVYDVVCPSEYMIMKLMSEDMLEPFSDDFFDEDRADNYYIKGVSPFIKETFETNFINDEPWSKYAAGYMWGVTGIVYNPEMVTREEASTWKIINNSKFRRQITVKDNVRDTMFAAIGALKSDLLMSDSFKNSPDYKKRLMEEMNDTSPETVSDVQDYLQQVKNNVYSFETDSAKNDMITRKAYASYQWSGDAVYTMDEAEKDDLELDFAVPMEGTDLYFDGWVMLKSGINGDEEKQKVAESFINFISMPENAVRNMDYIGYTSVISGGESDVIFDYVNWNYGAEEDEEDLLEYKLGYFFSGESDDPDYILITSQEQAERQLSAQYPDEGIMDRSTIMEYFDQEQTGRINQMWINIRCYNISEVPLWTWIIVVGITVFLAVFYVRKKLKKYKVKKQ